MSNRGSGLRTDSASVPTPAQAELIEAAQALADEDGLDSVSIRRVSTRVGMRPMSVYTHVASKDDLVARMFDQMSAEMLVPEPLPRGGRELLRLIAQRSFATYLAHPWMLQAFDQRPSPGPNQLRRAEQLAKAASALQLVSSRAWTAVSIVHEWTMGHALHIVTLREDKALRSHLQSVDPSAFPFAAGALAALETDESTFAEALEAVMDGIVGRFGAE